MKKKLIIVFIVILIVFGSLLIYRIFNGKTTKNTNEETSTIEENSNLELDNNDLMENNIENDTNIEENNSAENVLLVEEDEEMIISENNEEIKINIIINNKTYTATLYNNETVQELITQFPITLNMSDLNSNEKYSYLDNNFTTNSYKPNQINAGDIKLYGNNCIVVFYKNFNNSSYSYTDLGTIDDTDGFVSELTSENVTLRFEVR